MDTILCTYPHPLPPILRGRLKVRRYILVVAIAGSNPAPASPPPPPLNLSIIEGGGVGVRGAYLSVCLSLLDGPPNTPFTIPFNLKGLLPIVMASQSPIIFASLFKLSV